MRFEVLGPLRVTDAGEAVALGPPQQRKLLALLLTSPNHAVSVDRLIDEMWGEAPPATARHLVQDYVWRLRSAFGDSGDGARIERDDSGYALHVDAEELDALALAAAIERAAQQRPADVAAAKRTLDGALKLWRGSPFGELADDAPTLRAEAVRLEELYLRAVADRIDAALDLGRHEDLVGDLEELVDRHPYRERFWEQLMLALYRCGRQAEALRTYQRLRRTLADDLGLEPGPGAHELEGRILLHDPELLWEPLPPPCNLPAQLTSFVGRNAEIADIAKLVDTSRLVTLTGPGGIGKTRLAVEAAGRLLFSHPDGVWWVDLAQVRDPDLVVGALAETLGISAQPETPLLATIAQALSHRSALLVIDNCEHLAQVVADAASAVLRTAPGIRILATSRVPLRVPGELLMAIPPLAMPLVDEAVLADLSLSDAIRLFVERAATADRTFALSHETAPPVVEICRRLDALPLAIEMAAARVRVLSVGQIARSLDDRFSVLIGGEHDTIGRHQTLEATVDWSYRLLASEVRRVFDRFAVFAGAFRLDAAAAVAEGPGSGPPILEAITQLADASMLTTVTSGSGPARYRLLETLREFGLLRLRERGEEAHVSAAHSEHYIGLMIEASRDIDTPKLTPWIDRIGEAYPDIRVALAWSLEHQPRNVTLRAAPALLEFWYRTGNAPEARRWGERMLAGADDADPVLRSAAHSCLGFGGLILGEPELSHTHIAESVRLCRDTADRRALVRALWGMAAWGMHVGDFETVRDACNESLAICDEIGDRWGRALPLSYLGLANLFGGGSLDEARRWVEEALVLFRELGDIGSQVVMNPLFEISLRQGDLDAAERDAVERATIAAGTGWEATALVGLAQVFTAQANLEAAETTLHRAVRRALDTGLENWFRIALRDLAHVAALRGNATRAARLAGASRCDLPVYGHDAEIYGAIEAACEAALDPDAVARLGDEGYHMTHERLLTLVTEG